MEHITAGQQRRTVTFNLAKQEDLNLFRFSQSMNFSQFVKHHLRNEYNKVMQMKQKHQQGGTQ